MREKQEVMEELVSELRDSFKAFEFKSSKQRTMARAYQAAILEILLDIRDLLTSKE